MGVDPKASAPVRVQSLRRDDRVSTPRTTGSIRCSGEVCSSRRCRSPLAEARSQGDFLLSAISRFDLPSRTSAAEVARQVIRPKQADHEHTRVLLTPGRQPTGSGRPGARRQRRPTSLAGERCQRLWGARPWDEFGDLSMTGRTDADDPRPARPGGRTRLTPAGCPSNPRAQGRGRQR